MGAAYEIIADARRDRLGWLRARRDGLGGSDAAAVAGVNQYRSAIEVYAEKISSDPVSDDPPSEFARWGHILEPHILEQFRIRRPERTARREGRLLRSRARPWQLSTLDARQHKRKGGPPGLVEIKSTKFEWQQLPEDIWAQAMHQFAVTKLSYGSIVIFNRTSCEVSIVDIEPDHEYIAELTEIEAEFWSDLAQGIPPAPDGTPGARKALGQIYKAHVEGKTVELKPELLEVAEGLEAAKATIKEAEKAKREFENELIAAIGDAETAMLPDGSSYTYRLQHRKQTVQKASEFRVLRRRESN